MVAGSRTVSPIHVVVLIPLRDDWVSAAELIRRLDQAVSSHPYMVDVLLVDDGSIEDFPAAVYAAGFAAIRGIRVLRLRRNLGHQRAIAIGLVHIEKNMSCDAVLVMDGDGEDTAEGAIELIGAYSGKEAIFAKRKRRTESLIFRILYITYKFVHRVLTGVKVQVGNFSVLPSSYVGSLVVMSEMWNHYAAAVIRSGLPLTMISLPRGHRIAGRSKMNFVSLAAHGMSAISVYGDIVGVRLLIASMAGSLMAAVGILTVIAIRVFTHWAIPVWATFAVGTLVIVLMQCITMAFGFTFTFLSNRINFSFVPLRDYGLFVAGFEDVYQSA